MTYKYFIPEDMLLPMVHWRLHSMPERVLFTVDRENRISGYIDPSLFPPFSDTAAHMSAGDICDRKVHTVRTENTYRDARNIITEYPSIQAVPVVNGECEPLDILRRWQLRFKEEYFGMARGTAPTQLPYPPYAVAIWRATEIAASTGTERISVLEFGVASGDGLIACELLAREIGRIHNVGIDVYGFDGGSGLPENADWRDCPQCWRGGQFTMDREALESRLSDASLILGNITETWPSFIEGNNAPVGAMLIDVDYYSSTTAILNPLPGHILKFLPIVNMYFDDIGGSLQYQGESLAIREFNAKNRMIKISPETESFGEFNLGGRRYGFSKLKACMFYAHPQFNGAGFKKKTLHDFWR